MERQRRIVNFDFLSFLLDAIDDRERHARSSGCTCRGPRTLRIYEIFLCIATRPNGPFAFLLYRLQATGDVEEGVVWMLEGRSIIPRRVTVSYESKKERLAALDMIGLRCSRHDFKLNQTSLRCTLG